MIDNLLKPESLILIAVAALLLFGPKRLPEIGRSLGKAIREFHKATTEIKEELKPPAAPAAPEAEPANPSNPPAPPGPTS